MTIRDLNSLNALFQRIDNGDRRLDSFEIKKMTQEEISIWNIKEGQTYEEVAQNNNIQLQQQQVTTTNFNIGGNNSGSISQYGPAIQSGRDTKYTQDGPINETHGDNSPVTVINIDTVIASSDLLNALSEPAKEALARIFTEDPDAQTMMQELENDKSWQNLSLDKQVALLETVKYPRSVKSLVADGDFDDIKKNENGTVSLSSSQHSYNLSFGTNNEETLKNLAVVYQGNRADKAKGDQMTLINVDSSYLFISGDNGDDNRHLVVMENCGYNGTLKCDHTPDHQVTYDLRSGMSARNPISNYTDLTYHRGDIILHTHNVENKKHRKDHSTNAYFTYKDTYDKDSLVDGKTYNIKQNSKVVDYESSGIIKTKSYIASDTNGLPNPTKREPVKSFGV